MTMVERRIHNPNVLKFSFIDQLRPPLRLRF